MKLAKFSVTGQSRQRWSVCGWVLSKSGIAGGDDGLGPGRDLQFVEDVRHVVAHGFWFELESVGDLGVGEVSRDEVQDLVFAGCQLWERGVWGRPWRGSEIGHESFGDGGSEDGAAAVDPADGVDDVGFPGALEEVAAGSGLEGGEDGVVVLAHGQHQDTDLRACLQYLPGGLDAADAGHVEVHQDDVGLQGGRGVDRGLAVGGLADDVHIGLGVQQRVQPLAEGFVVVADQDLDGFQLRLPPGVWT